MGKFYAKYELIKFYIVSERYIFMIKGWLYRTTQYTRRMKKRFCLLDGPYLKTYKKTSYPELLLWEDTADVSCNEEYKEDDHKLGLEFKVYDIRKYKIILRKVTKLQLFLFILYPYSSDTDINLINREISLLLSQKNIALITNQLKFGKEKENVVIFG